MGFQPCWETTFNGAAASPACAAQSRTKSSNRLPSEAACAACPAKETSDAVTATQNALIISPLPGATFILDRFSN